MYLPFPTDIIHKPHKNGIFPDELKLDEVIALFKKADQFDKITIDLLVYSRTCLKFLKE